MRSRSLIAIVCCIAMILSLFTVGVSADTTVTPALKEGNHEKWIDRIDDLPDHAKELYSWLESNCTPDGVLADPTKAEQLNGQYVYIIDELTDTVDIPVEIPDGVADLSAYLTGVAQEYVAPIIQAFYAEVNAYAYPVLSAFDHDHPEVFFLRGDFKTGMSSDYGWRYYGGVFIVRYSVKAYLTLKNDIYDIRAEKYNSERTIADMNAELDALARAVCRDIPEGASRYEKIKYINDYLTKQSSYNSSDDLNNIDHDCREYLSALMGRTGTEGPVCEGYARALKVLCDKLGIPCVLVTGFGKNSLSSDGEAHMWNLIQMEDGKWYAADVTWNDPVVVGSSSTSAVSGYETDKWLLVGSDTEINGMTFAESHIADNECMGGLCLTNDPVLSSEAYDPDNVPEPEPVACINDVYYYSLTEAMQQVADGDIIYLLKTPADDDVPVVTKAMMITLEHAATVNFDPYNDFIGGDGIEYSFRGMNNPDGGATVVLTFADLHITMDLDGGVAIADRYSSFTSISGKNFKTPSKFWYTAPEGMMFSCWEINGEYYPHNTNIILNKDTTVKAIWAPLVELTDDEETLKNSVLTEDDKALGVNVMISLNVTDISETISPAEKATIAEQLGEHVADMYLDIDLVKTIMGQTSDVTQTNAPIKVTITVPADLVMPSVTYQIARIHDGIVDIIDGVFDPETKTFTFETDKFSTYVLIVKEESAGILGDVNGDTIVNSDDAVAILRYLAGYDSTGYDIDNGDYNEDNVTNSDDAVAILRMLAGYTD